ncbi:MULTISPECIES: hypothetical protein [unclassified Meridianimarinicoccus]|uniref:hypothetical protein n=1 Tax=unclassified Meridianimarinicoccus TaxID=2923344 RepID=UPI0018688D4C|nr:hypothetical protein [Fluviibacterium sp. MJW13]
MTQSSVAELFALLDAEFAAVRQGKFTQLDEILSQKPILLDAVAANPLSTQDQIRLQQRAVRNQAALKAAGEGIRSVLTRLADLRRLQGGADFYAADGRRKTVAPHIRGTRA